jgi:N-carbamoylputrescine amidase
VEQEFGPNDYYGSSYFCDPRGSYVGAKASDKEEELIVRDLNMKLVEEVRQTWQFYRDRRPELYGDIVAL